MKPSFLAGFLSLLSVASAQPSGGHRLSGRVSVDVDVDVDVSTGDGVVHRNIVISEGPVNPDGGKVRYVCLCMSAFYEIQH
jgi:hypothetical protein